MIDGKERCHRCAAPLNEKSDCRGSGWLARCEICPKCKGKGNHPTCPKCGKCSTCNEYRVKMNVQTGKLQILPCEC